MMSQCEYYSLGGCVGEKAGDKDMFTRNSKWYRWYFSWYYFCIFLNALGMPRPIFKLLR